MKMSWHDGRKNIIGENVRSLRTEAALSQKALAERIQLLGYEFDRLTVLRIEAGDRFVADFEILALARALNVPIERLFRDVNGLAS